MAKRQREIDRETELRREKGGKRQTEREREEEKTEARRRYGICGGSLSATQKHYTNYL